MPPNDQHQDLYFPSKRDWWIVGLIWFGVIVSVVGGIVPLVLGGAFWVELIFTASLIVGMDVLMLWVLYGTGYRITSDRLLIRCGPFTFPVNLNSIDSITPTRSPWSSPACSLDRLKIVYGVSHQSMMISPEDKSGFLTAIVQHCPSLMVFHGGVRKKFDTTSTSFAQAIQPQTII